MSTHEHPSAKTLTTADLAFIDAAIAMHKAVHSPAKASSDAPSVTLQSGSFTDVIQVVVAVVQIATFVYHAVKGSITVSAQLAELPAGLSSTASLKELISKRNELAKALGEPSVLS